MRSSCRTESVACGRWKSIPSQSEYNWHRFPLDSFRGLRCWLCFQTRMGCLLDRLPDHLWKMQRSSDSRRSLTHSDAGPMGPTGCWLPPKLTFWTCHLRCNGLKIYFKFQVIRIICNLNNLLTSSENVVCAKNWTTTNMSIVRNWESENDDWIIDLHGDHIRIGLRRWLASNDFWKSI